MPPKIPGRRGLFASAAEAFSAFREKYPTRRISEETFRGSFERLHNPDMPLSDIAKSLRPGRR